MNTIHLHHSYPESCRKGLDGTLQGTNQKDINCPDCLTNMNPPPDERVRLANNHRDAMLDVLLLPKNSKKGTWKDIPQDKLLEYLDGEIEEFYAALWDFRHHGGSIERVRSEGADVSAFVAMITDNCKGR